MSQVMSIYCIVCLIYFMNNEQSIVRKHKTGIYQKCLFSFYFGL